MPSSLQNSSLQPLQLKCTSLVTKDSGHHRADLSNTSPSKQGKKVSLNLRIHGGFFVKICSLSAVVSLESTPVTHSFMQARIFLTLQ